MSSPGVNEEGPFLILKKWKEDNIWVYVHARIGDFERHSFWAKVKSVSDTEVFLSGESAALSLPIGETKYFEPSERGTPAEISQLFSQFDSGLQILSINVMALLLGAKPKGE